MNVEKQSMNLDGSTCDLSSQNKQISNDLLFANKCLNILTKFTTFVDLVFNDYKTYFNPNHIKEYEKLKEEINEVLTHKQISADNQEIGILCEKNVAEKQSPTGFTKEAKQLVGQKIVLFQCKIKGCNYKTCVVKNLEQHIDLIHKNTTGIAIRSQKTAEELQTEASKVVKQTSDEKTEKMKKQVSNASLKQRPVSNKEIEILFEKKVAAKQQSPTGFTKEAKQLVGQKIVLFQCKIKGCNYKTCVVKNLEQHIDLIHKNTTGIAIRSQKTAEELQTEASKVVKQTSDEKTEKMKKQVSNASLKQTPVSNKEIEILFEKKVAAKQQSPTGCPKVAKQLFNQRIVLFQCTVKGCNYKTCLVKNLEKHINLVHKSLTATEINRQINSTPKELPTETSKVLNNRTDSMVIFVYNPTTVKTTDNPIVNEKNLVKEEPLSDCSKVVKQTSDENLVLVLCKPNDSVSNTGVNPVIKPQINGQQKDLNKKFNCFYCKKGFPFGFSLMVHIKKEHSKHPKVRHCSQLSTNSKQSAKRTKSGQKNQCTVSGCNKAFSSREYLGLHIKSVHRSHVSSFLKNNPKLKCDFDGCNFCTYSQSVFVNHRNRHEVNEPFVCSYESCGKKFLSFICLQKHLESVHQNIHKYKCDFDGCDYQTDESDRLICHKNVIHEGIRPFECPQCKAKFGGERNLKRHIQCVHPLDPKAFKCQYSGCEKSFKTNSGLYLHINRFHLKIPPKNVYRCDRMGCQYKSPAKSGLLYHISCVHASDKSYKCTFNGCHKSFKCQQYLDIHMNSHSMAKNYKCNKCKVSFKCKESIKYHNIRVHTSAPAIECDWPGCQYQTLFKSHLKKHQLIHKTEDEIEMFPCVWPECGKTFKTNHYLQRHIKVHTNDKRYACDWPGCQYRCITSGNLRKHLKVHQK